MLVFTLGPRCVPDACAELLDNAQALNVNTRAFKRVQKMVEDEKSLWASTQGSDEWKLDVYDKQLELVEV